MYVTQRITINFKTCIKAKLHRFKKRSIWSYLLGIIMFTYGKPDLFGSTYKTFIGLTLCLIPIIITTMVFGAKYLGKQNSLDGYITFTTDKIVIEPIDKQKETISKNWDWIQSIEETKTNIWLKIKRTFYICLDKKRLKPNEILFFKNLMK